MSRNDMSYDLKKYTLEFRGLCCYLAILLIIIFAEVDNFVLGLLMIACVLILSVKSTEFLVSICFISAIYSNHFVLVNTVYPRIFEIMALVCFLVHILLNKQSIILDRLSKTILFFGIYIIVITLIRSNTINGYTGMFNLIIAILMVLMVPAKLQIDVIARQVLCASIIIITKIGLQLITNNYSARVFTNGLDSGMITLWEGVNPNVFCVNIGVIASYIFASTIPHKKNSVKIIGGLLWLLCNLIILRVGSRMVLVASLLSAIVFLIVLSRDKINYSLNNLLKGLLTFLIIVISVSLLYYGVFSNNQLLSQRFTLSSILQTQGTGRVMIWIEVINHLKGNMNHLLFGIGLGSEIITQTLSNLGRGYYSAHNIFLEVLFDWGIIGATLFVSIIWQILKKAKKYNQISEICVFGLCFVCLMINGIGEGIYTIKLFWYIIMILSVCFKQYEKYQ